MNIIKLKGGGGFSPQSPPPPPPLDPTMSMLSPVRPYVGLQEVLWTVCSHDSPLSYSTNSLWPVDTVSCYCISATGKVVAAKLVFIVAVADILTYLVIIFVITLGSIVLLVSEKILPLEICLER